jgi:hypothetical protein
MNVAGPERNAKVTSKYLIQTQNVCQAVEKGMTGAYSVLETLEDQSKENE